MSFQINGAEGGVQSSLPIPFAEQEVKIDNPHWVLIEAARDGDRTTVEALLSKYPIPYSFLYTATGEAVKRGHLDLAVDISQFAADYPEMIAPDRSSGKGQKAMISVSPEQPAREAPNFFANKYVNQIVESPITGIALGMIVVYIGGLFM
jgi:hypothetical protein